MGLRYELYQTLPTPSWLMGTLLKQGIKRPAGKKLSNKAAKIDKKGLKRRTKPGVVALR